MTQPTELRDYFAASAPEPTKEKISEESMKDFAALITKTITQKRTELEIIADVAYEFADAMLLARSK